MQGLLCCSQRCSLGYSTAARTVPQQCVSPTHHTVYSCLTSAWLLTHPQHGASIHVLCTAVV